MITAKHYGMWVLQTEALVDLVATLLDFPTADDARAWLARYAKVHAYRVSQPVWEAADASLGAKLATGFKYDVEAALYATFTDLLSLAAHRGLCPEGEYLLFFPPWEDTRG